MKPVLTCFLILLITATAIHAQTQEEINEALKYYPLEVGNYWEYRSVYVDEMFPIFNDTTFHSIEVIADTTLSNGQTYKKLRSVNYQDLAYYEFDIHINDKGLRVAIPWSGWIQHRRISMLLTRYQVIRSMRH